MDPKAEVLRGVGDGSGQLLEAFGRPGMPPRWTSSSKEGVGSRYSTSSRVWFTISHGILNEIYFPTIDHPQIEQGDMQYLVTDGESFFHEERRDLDDVIEGIEADALGYRVISSDRNQRYRLVKEIISDPHQPVVLINTRLEGVPEFLKKLRVYALLAPHLEVGGYGNSARRFKTAGQNVLIAGRLVNFLRWERMSGSARVHVVTSDIATDGRIFTRIFNWTGNLTRLRTAMWP